MLEICVKNEKWVARVRVSKEATNRMGRSWGIKRGRLPRLRSVARACFVLVHSPLVPKQVLVHVWDEGGQEGGWWTLGVFSVCSSICSSTHPPTCLIQKAGSGPQLALAVISSPSLCDAPTSNYCVQCCAPIQHVHNDAFTSPRPYSSHGIP